MSTELADDGASHAHGEPDAEAEAAGALRPLVEALRDLGVERIDVVAALAAAAYRRAPGEGRRRLREDARAAAARLTGAFAFLDSRRPGQLALRVFNATEATHGWTSAGTVVELNTEDSPFLLSTLVEELSRQRCEIVEQLHPVLGVVRDDDGRVRALEPARTAANRESLMHIELAERLDSEQCSRLEDDLRRVLGDAKAATRDFEAMRQRVGEVAERTRREAASRYGAAEAEEAAALLEWLLDQNFVFLGYREYELLDISGELHAAVRSGTGLGILADESSSTYADPVPLRDVPEGLRSRMTGGQLLTIGRTNRASTVHRQTRMIYVGVKRVDDRGKVVGEDRVLGLFAQKAYAQPAGATPVLRRKLQRILELEDVVDNSHDERTLRTLFEAFPKHELFTADTDHLRRTLVSIMAAQRRQNVRVLTRVDPSGRGVAVLVALPRERFNAALRQRVQSLLLDRFRADSVDYHLSMGERDHALMHFLLHVDAEAADSVAIEELEQEVAGLTRTWDDRLRDALADAHGADAGRALARRWSGRFPPGYQALSEPAVALREVAELEALLGGDQPVRMALQRLPGSADNLLRFKLYKRDGGVELSSFVPILESLGFVVVEEVPHALRAPTSAGDEDVHIHDFGVRLATRGAFDEVSDGPLLAEAAHALWSGSAEVDSLNRLVFVAKLAWDDVAVLRAYRRFRRQVGTNFTESYQDDAFVSHPDVARSLVELFHVRFAPDADGSYEALSSARARVEESLEQVERLDSDRILRGTLALIEATVRTNRYVERTADRGSAALSLKIESANVPDVPKPVPYAEVFVYSPELEGIHLRGGPVARGGIRWSDRQEDVRAEVLGLMKAQMVKNSIIVPTGAKGGFVLKRPPAEGAALRAAVREQYEVFIKALLDITGNVVGGEVVPPPRVRRRDGDDPYLVVAADRGTAALSDVANAISEAYGFWLGDAFASGGSSGYDHKKLGITARGAWVAVQRHFRELDVDVQEEPVTVVGIGDMSGDVFGNGMLQSRAIKLVAAFDHRHVFVDPDPDPEAAYEERRRLFETPGTTWADYDTAKLSPGGGVWSRSAKVVRLSAEARALLRLEADELSPPELVRAILRAPVDLLFAGGIGTFVKASSESHADVGERANDQVRIDASELAARVVGEGANLALTQRARIQYARRGGRCNTDAIDNCAGVNTSDREVNLKILLKVAEEEGLLSERAERDALLESMAGDVAEAVLRDCYLQTWTITQELHASPGGLDAYEQLMVDLEPAGGDQADRTRMVAGRLDRAVEVLPSSAEMQERKEARAGLNRPELCVLLGYSKLDLRTRVLASELPDQPHLARLLEAYFPPAATTRFGELLVRHRLRRELVATVLANALINRMGVTYVSRTAHEFGCMAWEVAAAHLIAREVLDAEEHWRAIEALDGWVDARLQLELKGEVDHVVNACTRAYLRQRVTDVGATIDADGPAFAELEKVVTDLGPAGRRRARAERVRAYTDLGIDETLAERLVNLSALVIVPDVVSVARTAAAGVGHVADVFLHLNDALPLDYLFERLLALEPRDNWERWHQQGLLDDLREARREAALQIVRELGDESVGSAVRRFVSDRAESWERLSTVLGYYERREAEDLAALAVTVGAVRKLVRART